MGGRTPTVSGHYPVSSPRYSSLLSVLLGADITIVTAFALAAVGGLRWEASVTLAANHLVAFVGGGESSERRLNLDHTNATATKTEDEMEGRLLLNVVVRESAAVPELLAGEDQTLLIGRDAFLVLDLGSVNRKKQEVR